MLTLPDFHTCCGRVLRARGLALAAVLGSMAFAASVGGCTSSGPTAPSPSEISKATPVALDEYARLGYRLEWRGFPTMLPGEHITRLEPLGDVVVAQESAGVLTALDARSGNTRWSDQPSGKLTKYVGILRTDSQLLVSSESEVYFYDVATGTLKNRQHLAQVVNTKPVRVGDMLVYGCTNGQILGHLLLNGFRAWGSGLTGSIEVDPVLTSNGNVAVCSTTGELAIVDPQSGSSQGRAKMFSGPDAPIGVSETALYFASSDHSLYAFSSEAAAPIWRKRTDAPLRRKPVFYNGKVYCDMGQGEVAGGGKGMTCYDAVSGKLVWSNPAVTGEVIALRNKRLIVWDGTSAMALQFDDGVLAESVKLAGVTILKPDAFENGNLYAVTPTGLVAKLAPK
jgi:outer membrane protein assembly factor BamB